MKSRWTILLNPEAWKTYIIAFTFEGGFRLVAPEQYPCLVTYVIAEGKAEFVYVYKQEAYVLNACPTDAATFNPDHPFPGTP